MLRFVLRYTPSLVLTIWTHFNNHQNLLILYISKRKCISKTRMQCTLIEIKWDIRVLPTDIQYGLEVEVRIIELAPLVWTLCWGARRRMDTSSCDAVTVWFDVILLCSPKLLNDLSCNRSVSTSNEEEWDNVLLNWKRELFHCGLLTEAFQTGSPQHDGVSVNFHSDFYMSCNFLWQCRLYLSLTSFQSLHKNNQQKFIEMGFNHDVLLWKCT